MRNVLFGLLALTFCCGVALAGDGNRLTYLDDPSPYYVSREFPRLITPQWVGEEGVDAVVVLAIDDMRGHEKWETYLRPILERLKKIDGRAPASIMTCQIDPADPHLQLWLKEGLSLEAHTYDHPCPILAKGDFAKAKATYDRTVDLMSRVPNSHPVAFRTPCCDSLNTFSPRLIAEIFNGRTPENNFLQLDSSVFNLITADDPELPRALVTSADGSERFRRYLPGAGKFVNVIENYPYPYVINRTCWEMPCVTPSDWSAQNLQKPCNPRTVEDMKAALDAVVIKQGVFNLVFHPYDWLHSEQIADIVDYADKKYGHRVKFLNFREVLERLNKNLLDGVPLRDERGGDGGVRLADLDGDGYMDVVVGGGSHQLTRVWQAKERRWDETPFPISLVSVAKNGIGHERAVRFGIVAGHPAAIMLGIDGCEAWEFDAGKWAASRRLASGITLQADVGPRSDFQSDAGFRLRDLDGDGTCEAIVGNPDQQSAWRLGKDGWEPLEHAALPTGATIVDAHGNDAGLRFVDLDEDGHDDIVFSNQSKWSVHLFESLETGWRKIAEGTADDPHAIPPIVRGGANNGAWAASGSLYWQNENTDKLPNLIDRRSYSELLADVPPGPKSPEASLCAIHVPPGFKVDLVAAEPLVEDPIAIAWAADGKLWVVEMGDYPLGIDGKGKPGGEVRCLEDRDGDGRYDHSSVFVSGLAYPTGVMPWRDGVLIVSAPEILFARDTDGDGQADEREVLYRGLGEGNPQHRANGLRYGLDNWIYCANGDSGGQIESVKTGKKVAIGGRDFRIEPGSGGLDAQTGQSQFLRDRDDWGNWFGSNNSNPMYQFVLEDNYLRRNPFVAPPDVRVNVSITPGASAVFPRSRMLARFNDFNAAGRFTSACSAAIYRDNLLGDAFYGNSFVCEPVHNLVHREIVTPTGLTFSSRRAATERESEFLASSDNWFRPTMARPGPDGALWVCDMYRAVIEHPEWIPKEWQAKLDLRAGHDRGHIYRVYPVDHPPRKVPALAKASTAELVSALDSPSGWQRDMAQQLLVEHGGKAAVAPLTQMLKHHANPLARLHALCTLDGLSALDEETLLAALKDAHPGVRRHAVRLAEQQLAKSEKLQAAVAALVDDADLHVKLQLACSLGEWPDAAAGKLLGKLALTCDDGFVQGAVRSSLNGHNLAAVIDTLHGQKADPPGDLVEALVATAVGLKNDAALRSLIESIVPGEGAQPKPWQVDALVGLIEALERNQLSLAEYGQKAPAETRAALERLSGMFATALKTVADNNAEKPQRLSAIQLLGRDPAQREAEVKALGGLLVPQTSTELQHAALAALARIGDRAASEAILAGWKGFGPDLRSGALDALLRRKEQHELLASALEQGALRSSDFTVSQRNHFLTSVPAAQRAKIEKLLGGAVDRDRQQVVAKYQATLSKSGNASAGAAVFQKTCSVCHRIGDVGKAVGPDLSALADRAPQVLLVAILDPNRAVEARYLSYTATTRDGLAHSGMLAAETSTSVTLVAQEGKQQVLLRADLEALESSGKSLMPEGVEKDISPAQMADLIAFLGSARKPPRVFAGNHPHTVGPEGLRGEFWLLASDCEIHGSTLVFEPTYSNLGYWSSADDHAVWSIDVVKPGNYNVQIDYACSNETAGNLLALSVAGQRLEYRVTGTGNWETYRQVQLGTVKLERGRQEVVAHAADAPNGALLDLKAVRLLPVR